MSLFFSKNNVSKIIALDDSLKWEKEIKEAREYVEKGFSLIWEIKLDLISQTLSNEGQFNKNAFTLEYFKNNLYTQFEKASKGVILYRGKSDFSNLSVTLDNLKALGAILPESLDLFLFFEEETFFLAEAIFDVFHVATKKVIYPNIFPTMGWDRFSKHGYFSEELLEGDETDYKSALLLPKLDLVDEVFVEEMKGLLPCRVIPEAVLTDHWQDVEKLFVFPEFLTPQGNRKLAGFRAAGGEVVEVRGKILNSDF